MYRTAKPFPLLQVGERVRFEGSEWEVSRVTPCAAYLRSKARRQVTVYDHETGEPRTFMAAEGRMVAISPRSCVERIERNGDV